MAVCLNKVHVAHSLRAYGRLPSGAPPHRTVIAGCSLRAIASAMGGTAYRIERYDPADTFCVEKGGCHFLYADPAYRGYRQLAALRFGRIHQAHDIDHSLAKVLAPRVGAAYVLLAMVPEKPNRRHGGVEKLGVSATRKISLGKVIYPDERIFHKLLGRLPYARQPASAVRAGFDESRRLQFGLTLKQQGLWNLAFGFHQPTPASFVQRLRPI